MAERLDLGEITQSLAALDVTSLTSDELGSSVLEAQALLNAAHALSAALLDAFDTSGAWADDGALSASAWAAARTGVPKRVVRAQARAGRVQRALPSVAAPARAGRLSPDHLGVLASCERQRPELAARDEALLVDQALHLDADAFRVAGRHWCDLAADVDEPAPTPEPTSEVHLSRSFDGWWVLNGQLSPDDGALLHAALEAGVDRRLRAQRDGDPAAGLVASQMRAQALVDLAAQAQRVECGQPSVPDRYRVGIVVTLDERDDLADAACDSAMYRIVVDADGEVLDVGRDTRLWPKGIRRAITHRDGGCVFPGCDRPPSWCDVHHNDHWEDGGTTSVDNGALLCRSHHTFIHRKRWKVRIERGRAHIYREDGSQHTITRWEAA